MHREGGSGGGAGSGEDLGSKQSRLHCNHSRSLCPRLEHLWAAPVRLECLGLPEPHQPLDLATLQSRHGDDAAARPAQVHQALVELVLRVSNRDKICECMIAEWMGGWV